MVVYIATATMLSVSYHINANVAKCGIIYRHCLDGVVYKNWHHLRNIYKNFDPPNFIAKCLSMKYVILIGHRVPTVEYAICIYINYSFIYLFIGMSKFMVQSEMVYRVNLFAMHGMQCHRYL